MVRLIVFCIAIFSLGVCSGQTKYFVYFNNKRGSSFDPYTYFDQKAIERRIRQDIPLYDSTDFPVTDAYVNTVSQWSDSIGMISRWMNGMSIYAGENEINIIRSLPFVKGVELLGDEPFILSNDPDEESTHGLSKDELDLLKFQLERHKADEFRKRGLTGKGIRIAVFDVGFPNVDTHDAFANMRRDKRIIATYDFIKKRDNVYYSMSHGTMVLSCIAGWYDDIPIGMATDAEFLLAKTERPITEKAIEEDSWLAAAEWADKNGADIISSSLAYTKQRYTVANLDGKTSLVSRAAEMAFSKGILVINAAGNEGSGNWEYLATPADAEDVLSVGGTDPYTDAHIYFSSYGPTADGRLKPNVCSLGEAIVASKTGFARESGTSFATPLIAGFAACAWQSNPDLKNTEIFEEMEECAHLYPYYDYAHGYGIPQADHFLGLQKKRENLQTFTIDSSRMDGDSIFVEFNENFFPDSTHKTEVQPRNFYYEFIDDGGKLIYFGVVVPDERKLAIVIPYVVIDDDKLKYAFRAHFEGCTQSMKLK